MDTSLVHTQSLNASESIHFYHCHQDSAVMPIGLIELCVFCVLSRFLFSCLCSGWQHNIKPRDLNLNVSYSEIKDLVFLRFYFACPEHFLGNINTTSENYNLG